MTDHAPLTTSPLPLPLRIEDFFLLDEAGAFGAYGKTELIGGNLFYMNAQHRPHARAKLAMYETLRDWIKAHDPGFAILVEATVAMPPHSAPEPDIVLTTEPEGVGPVPVSSVRLLVEVADTTQKSDLGLKADIYAANGVAEYWVVDLPGGVIHQMWAPAGEAYAQRREVAFGEPIKAATIAGLSVTPAI
jgi:Uma2 family endonuclease